MKRGRLPAKPWEPMVISEVKSEVILDMPREQAWETLRDLSQAHNYVPGIIKTEVVTEKKEGVGASRLVYQTETRALQETVTEWNDGYGFKIRLHKGDKDSPFKNSFFRYEIADTADNKTRLTTSMGYTPPLGPLGVILDKLFLNKIIAGVIRKVALSMKHYYDTGSRPLPADIKRLRSTLKGSV